MFRGCATVRMDQRQIINMKYYIQMFAINIAIMDVGIAWAHNKSPSSELFCQVFCMITTLHSKFSMQFYCRLHTWFIFHVLFANAFSICQDLILSTIEPLTPSTLIMLHHQHLDQSTERNMVCLQLKHLFLLWMFSHKSILANSDLASEKSTHSCQCDPLKTIIFTNSIFDLTAPLHNHKNYKWKSSVLHLWH